MKKEQQVKKTEETLDDKFGKCYMTSLGNGGCLVWELVGAEYGK
jgi:hypothetical protein